MTSPIATTPAFSPAPECVAAGARRPGALVDRFGRRIDYLRVSLTERCNLRCDYCVAGTATDGGGRVDASAESPGRASLTMAEVERLCAIAAEEGVRRVRLTGGEPLLAEDVAGLVRRLRALPGIEDVALTTNGTLLAAQADALARAGLSRVNISLDSLDADEFARITGGGRLGDALAGVQSALAAGLRPVKLNAVVTGSAAQDLLGLASLSLAAPLHVRFIERMALGPQDARDDGSTAEAADAAHMPQVAAAGSTAPGTTRDRIAALADAAGLGDLEAVPLAEQPTGWGPARVYRFPGAAGTVGFISAATDGSCARCSRLRLTADGYLRPCLLGPDEVDLAAVLRAGTDDDVRATLYAAVAAKPARGNAGAGAVGTRPMTRIGG